MSTVVVQSNSFSESEVRDVVDAVLQSQLKLARARREDFASKCREFEETH